MTGDPTGAVIIVTIVVLSVGLGFVNEYRSAQALAMLHGDIHYSALALRDDAETTVDVTELVCGDVVDLAVGGVVPADLRLLSATALAILRSEAGRNPYDRDLAGPPLRWEPTCPRTPARPEIA